MNFSTKKIEVTAAPTGKYLDLGINDNVTLFAITSGESSKKGTPFLEVEVGKDIEATLKSQFYMSDAAQERSQQRIIHLLVDGLGVDRNAVDAAGEAATSLPNYAARLNALIPKGNKFRIKLTGEEYYKDGDVKVAKRINSKFFAEPMSVSPSRLKFDKGNKYDYVVAPTPNDGSDLPSGDAPLPAAADGDNDLPF